MINYRAAKMSSFLALIINALCISDGIGAAIGVGEMASGVSLAACRQA